MAFETRTRYGYEEAHGADADVAQVIATLLDELGYEEFDEPDDEHTQVSLSNGGWGITVQVSGLVTLDNLSWITGSIEDKPIESLYMRDVPRDQLILLLSALTQGEFETVLAASWVPYDRLSAYERDYYRA
jgi:hypothetical protein